MIGINSLKIDNKYSVMQDAKNHIVIVLDDGCPVFRCRCNELKNREGLTEIFQFYKAHIMRL